MAPADALNRLIGRPRALCGQHAARARLVENVNVQKLALQTKPSLVKKMYGAKKIDIVGSVYDLASGKVTLI